MADGDNSTGGTMDKSQKGPTPEPSEVVADAQGMDVPDQPPTKQELEATQQMNKELASAAEDLMKQMAALEQATKLLGTLVGGGGG